MTFDDIITWGQNEFQPIPLATPINTQRQLLENAIRYWNVNSAYPLVEMVAVTGRSISMPNRFKSVVNVYPATQASSIFQDHPLFSLLGIVLLDNITQDLISLGEAYKTYKVYVGTDFRWKYVRSGDPQVGGKLLLINLPVVTPSVAVVGTRRIVKTQEGSGPLDWEEINDEVILAWLLYYYKALLKQSEGNLLRKGDVIGVKSDGQQLFTEGDTEKKELEERLAVDGRWVAFAKRF